MDELITFLSAQLDDDERVARAAIAANGGQASWPIEEPDSDWMPRFLWLNVMDSCDPASIPLAMAEHISRNDPESRLAEIEAKRRILDLHSPQPTGYVDGIYRHGETGQLQCEYCADLCHSGSGLSCGMPDAPWPCPTVRMLAQPYAGRDGWQEEWRPTEQP